MFAGYSRKPSCRLDCLLAIPVIVVSGRGFILVLAEQYDVEPSIAVATAAEASKCEPLSVGVFSGDDL